MRTGFLKIIVFELLNGLSISKNVQVLDLIIFSMFITKFEVSSIMTFLFQMRNALPEVSEFLNTEAGFTSDLEQTLPIMTLLGQDVKDTSQRPTCSL